MNIYSVGDIEKELLTLTNKEIKLTNYNIEEDEKFYVTFSDYQTAHQDKHKNVSLESQIKLFVIDCKLPNLDKLPDTESDFSIYTSVTGEKRKFKYEFACDTILEVKNSIQQFKDKKQQVCIYVKDEGLFLYFEH